jgi:hypothetical protein
MSVCIELYPDAVDHPFADMMAQLLRQNLDDHPEKVAVAKRMSGRVAIVVTDLDLAVTLSCSNGRIAFHTGIAGIPDVTIRAPSEWISKMSLVEMMGTRVRFPDPRGPVAKEIAAAERDGIIRTHASPTSMLLVLRLTEVLSIN